MGAARLSTRTDGFTSDGRLARSPATELTLAMEHLDALLRAAHAVLGASGHAPRTDGCAEAGCGLAAVGDGPDLCRLAHQLIGERPVPATSSAVLGLAVRELRRALLDAMDAVRACRQTAHPNGACWFVPQTRRDGCAEVLRLAHAVA
ncbi:hypothetical protein [Egicoccus halophilus]|uniref:Uncharacterized protein n=1 Tax=Egicoccus halophilus TaxID=1670830 RepID=A0A8J3A720_9ACTN|nr:hypothetical protein [Egicoccus halophilus]GGI05098.1 hypothetical protein GCM10011354_12400 [Egicoccus halophilus]